MKRRGGAVARKRRREERIGYERVRGCLLLNGGLVMPLVHSCARIQFRNPGRSSSLRI